MHVLLAIAVLTALALPALAEVIPFGVCAHLARGDEFNEHEQELQLMEEAGIRWARADWTWGYFEPQDNQWRFDAYDTVVATAKRHHVNLLPILCYNVEWAFPAHEHLDQWCDYVKTVAERYQNDLRYWEVWNEPNIGFWQPEPNPAQYTDLLIATYRTIKEVNPDLQVVYGGTAGIPFEFIRQTFELGAYQAFDVMAIHPYRYPQVPEYSNLVEDLQKTWALMEEFGPRKPLWITEFGWPTHITPAIHDPHFLPQLIRYSATLRFPNRSNFRAAVLHAASAPGFGALGLAVNQALDALPDVSSRLVALEEIADLNPAETQILVMPTGEHYPFDYYDEMLAFVRQGGLLVHLGGVPFYYGDRLVDGKWQEAGGGEHGRAPLHVGWKAWWTEEGLPQEAGITKLVAPPESGIKLPEHLTSTRWLTDTKLQGNDRFVPLLAAYEGERFIGYPVALYLYDSDLKGAFLGTILNVHASGVPEDTQALYLPRAFLLCLGEGLENVLWYEFRDGGNNPAYNEDRFGIIRNDLSPKPAYRAYQALTHALGGAKLIRKMDVGEGSYCYIFSHGETQTAAVWCTKGTVNVRLRVTGTDIRVMDYLGEALAAAPAKGVLSLTASEKVTYVTGLESVAEG